MSNLVFFKTIETDPKSDLLLQGYSRRTTVGEPRLSELVATYHEIGYDIKLIEHQVEPNTCGICFQADAGVDDKEGATYFDIYVRLKKCSSNKRGPE